MITYDQIEKANQAIITTDIKGKDYAEVNQRIKAFRMVYPTGRISTTMLSNEGGICVFYAQVGYWADDGEFKELGTGTAYEKEGTTFINKTSYIENCETSAVGRALGMAGFGIDTSVASYEEVQNAINNQEQAEPKATEPKATDKQYDMICDLYTDAEIDSILDKVKVKSIRDLTIAQASALISKRAGKK